ncbi:helix-turn-helix domain-containing protein [Promicromonospora sp. NPDC060271]|uniref:helix-turn-helix domain-containing protein n=1 Tax=Promicromonospora sp. NPDC060271 TaxID=3347089 RepID=UPI0036582D17
MTERSPGGQRGRPSALWLWSSTDASHALRSRDLAVILRAYRRLNGLSQEQVAALLGYDKTYVSMIETRRRTITDVGVLRHIAQCLGVPPHVLGVTAVDDATTAALTQFAESVLKLADIARQAGRTVDAIDELWPLVARLEARAIDGYVDRGSWALLGRARASLGIALGTVLPEERLATAARWTGQALNVAQRLDEPQFLAYAFAMHGNELRKAGRTSAAIERLSSSIELRADPAARITALAFLARAAGEAGDAALFDTTIDNYQRQLDTLGDAGMLGNQFTFHEVRIRGLVATGRGSLAARLMESLPVTAQAVAPQWTVIERVTAGEVHLVNGDRDAAEEALLTALSGAEKYRLPHQAQRAIRIASRGADAVVEAGQAILARFRRLDP